MPTKPWDQMTTAEKVEDLNQRIFELYRYINAGTDRLSREIEDIKDRLPPKT
jgi:hypothetical protein